MIKNTFFKLFLVACFFASTLVRAEGTVVRMDFAVGEPAPVSIYIQLFDQDAPDTVANFLNYIEDSGGERRYDGTFVHRVANNFFGGLNVMQGGGFYLDTNGAAAEIRKDGPLTNNEYNAALHTNTEGTIAMARTSDLGSAKSQWFINITDNDLPDFAVFGELLGDGLTLALRKIYRQSWFDLNAELNGASFGDAFSIVPVMSSDYQDGDPVTDSDLAVLERVVINPPARIFSDTEALDFGVVTVNSVSDSQTITLQNIGGTDLPIGNIPAASALDAAFLMVTDGCSDRVLAPAASCQLQIQFQPTGSGEVMDTLSIPSGDQANPVIVVSLAGIGAFQTPTLESTPDTTVDFGNIGLADIVEQTVTIRNIGAGGSLELGQLAVSGIDAANFSIVDGSDSCSGAALLLDENCSVTLSLSADTLGTQSASLSIPATPQSQTAELTLTGEIVSSQARLMLSDFKNDTVKADKQFDKTHSEPFAVAGNGGIEDLVFIADGTVPALRFTGPDADVFSISNDECTRLAPDAVCTEIITIAPTERKTLSATLEIRTNDPDQPVATLNFSVTASIDGDGVPDDVEATAANNGDGNADGIPDAEQHNVASLLNAFGESVTLESDIGTRLSAVRSSSKPVNTELPVAVGALLDFLEGFFEFRIEDVPAGGSATVTLYLAPGKSANTYFKYDSETNRWYQFDYNPTTGTGAVFDGNKITLHFVDGNPNGDVDKTANGIIVDPGGPGVITADGSGGGGGGGCSLSSRQHQTVLMHVDIVLLLIGLLGLKVFRGGLRGR